MGANMRIFSCLIIIIVCINAVSLPASARYEEIVSPCGNPLDDRKTISDCSSIIEKWAFHEETPRAKELSERYYLKGASAYYSRGRAYQNLEANALAIQDYTEAIRLSKEITDPMLASLISARNSRALLYFKAGLYDLSISDYTMIIESNSSFVVNAYTYRMRGQVYLQKGDFEHALADFNRALRAEPTSEDTLIARAKLYIAENRLGLAIEDCTTVLKLWPNSSSAYLRRGIAYELKKADTLAEEDLTKSITIDPNEILGFYYRSLIYERQGRLKDAVNDWRKIMPLQTEDNLAREMRQEISEKIEKFEH